MTTISPALLSDRDLLDATARSVDVERRSTADLIALLAELDARRLYLGEGYSSLFTYCTSVLHLSEPAAYSRITTARAARRFPIILALLADGAVTLTTISLLAAHLTDDNHEALLESARHKSKRDVERLVACLYPQPDIPSSIRQLPTPAVSPSPAVEEPRAAEPAPLAAEPPRPRVVIAPLAPERYLLRVTLSREGHDRLERARALLRHTIPNGDPAAVIERALIVLLDQLERRKTAATKRPSAAATRSSRTRTVPAAARRAVWARDEGRCAFVGSHGRCAETAFLEFHHVKPFAAGGPTTTDNLQLRCRAHNAYEAECHGNHFSDRKCASTARKQAVVESAHTRTTALPTASRSLAPRDAPVRLASGAASANAAASNLIALTQTAMPSAET